MKESKAKFGNIPWFDSYTADIPNVKGEVGADKRNLGERGIR